jgi:hypothetical protein
VPYGARLFRFTFTPMLKRNAVFVGIMALLAAITGFMMSRMTTVGRWGLSIFYKEYGFLKIWWQAALLVFAIWMIIYAAHRLVQQKVSKASALAVNLISLMFGIAGLYFTYLDFRNDFSHRLMGERFHIGFYLFWLGWMSISIYFLAQKSSRQLIVTGKAG